MHEHRQARAGANKDGLEAHLVKQLVDGEHLADDHVGHDLDAHRLELFDLVSNDGLRQTEFRDAIDQNAAGGVQRFKDGDGVALLGKLGCARQTGGAGADDGNLDAVGFRLLRHGVDVLAVPVGDKALETADGDRLALDAADALGLALRFLRADTAGQSRQRVGGGNDLICGGKIALRDLCDKVRDLDVDRAAADAERLLAVQAALCLFHGHFRRVAEGNFLKIMITDVRILLRHRSLGHLHIRHFRILPYYLMSSSAIFCIRHLWLSRTSASRSR